MVFGIFRRKGLHDHKLAHQLERDARLDPRHLADEIADVREELAELPGIWESIAQGNLKADILEHQRRSIEERKIRLEKRLAHLEHLLAMPAKKR